MPLEECHVEDCSRRLDRACDRRRYACLRAAGSRRTRRRAALAPERGRTSARSATRASRRCMPGSSSTPSRRRTGRRWKARCAILPSSARERFAARASADRPKDPVERLALRADVMTQRGAALKKLADAAGPLYKSLDDGAEAPLHRAGAARRAPFARRARRHARRHGWMHRGPGGSSAARWDPMAARGRNKPRRVVGRRPTRPP